MITGIRGRGPRPRAQIARALAREIARGSIARVNHVLFALVLGHAVSATPCYALG